MAIGLFLLVWGIWYELPDSVWTYMAVSGTIYLSGAGAALVGGIYWRGASTAGAWAALLGGLVAVSGLFLDSINGWLKSAGASLELTGNSLGLFNFIFCAVLFVSFSLLFPDDRQRLRPATEGDTALDKGGADG